MKSIGKIIMIILGIIAGPLELLTGYLLIGTKESSGFFKFIGFLIGFIICFRVLQFILMIIFNLIEKNFDDDGSMGLSCLFSAISIFVTWFIALKVFTDNGMGTIIVVMILLLIPHLLLIPWGSGGNTSKNTSKSASSEKKPSFKFGRAYIKDQFGNIKGTADTISYEDKYGGFETTEIKDSFGNTSSKIDKYK